MNKGKVRYKYQESTKGFKMNNVKCPVCKSIHKNWIKVVEHTSWSGNVKLLVECWSGDTSKDLPKHLYLIKLSDLPIVEIQKTK